MEEINLLQSPFRPDGYKFDDLDALSGAICSDCGERFFPSRESCLSCSGSNMEPVSVSKQGKIYSLTVIHRAPPGFQTPYGCGWVITDDGIKLWTMYKGPQEKLRVGLPVKIVFEKHADRTIYLFEPIENL